MSQPHAEGTGPTPSSSRTSPEQHDVRPSWAPTSAGAPASPAAAGGPRAEEETVPQRRRRDREPRRRSTAWSWLRETAIILVSALVLSLVVKTFLVQAFFIPSQSMHDTLVENDRILVSKLTPGPFDLRRGDIVVFKDPGGWLTPEVQKPRSALAEATNEALTFVGLLPQDAGEHLVKRVIGLPGDHVACAGPGQPVTVNGVPLDETYLAPGSQPSEMAFDVVVPADSLWLMGDNRQQSADSRRNMGRPGGGSVPMENVVGVAFVTVWPLDRFTILSNPSDVFANVPDAG
ncbi:signal peptidase I [Cellulomonas iranensis]|uniref:Signal peptidase I n=1 Tax=Cellulomonas iranensis TaxID=76862 RepID=A0ABU0GES6_9CELL|nr:signal peptidase I [Cellulomonas iranensis]MDQ0423855.1 signal peptidase I [Cellulomonas iranensis]